MSAPRDLVVSSEFASVALRINTDGNGPRLEITDLRTGHVGHLDALELETLAWLPEGALHHLLDPSQHRWKADEQGEPDPATSDRVALTTESVPRATPLGRNHTSPDEF